MARARVKFDDETDQALRDAARLVSDLLSTVAYKQAESTGRGLATCVNALFRPYLVDQASDKAREALIDNRERLWTVKIWFWDVTAGLKGGELVAENDIEEVRGLRGVAEIIREYADLVHEDDNITALDIPELVAGNMAKRMGGMRAAISKAGGAASLRIYYDIFTGQKFLCHADISRA